MWINIYVNFDISTVDFLKEKDLLSHQILKRIQVFATGVYVTSARSKNVQPLFIVVGLEVSFI